MRRTLYSIFIIIPLFLVACTPSKPAEPPEEGVVKSCIAESDLDRNQNPPELVCDGKEYILAASNVLIKAHEITDGNQWHYPRNLDPISCPESPDKKVYKPECGLQGMARHARCKVFEDNVRFILKSGSFTESGIFDVVLERSSAIPDRIKCGGSGSQMLSAQASVEPDPNISFGGKDYIFLDQDSVPNSLLSPNFRFLDTYEMSGVTLNVYKNLIEKPTGGDKLLFLTEIDANSPPADVEYLEYMELEGPQEGQDDTLQLKSFTPSQPDAWWLDWVGGCKPVIYLYPEETTTLSVNAKPKGWVTDSIPMLSLDKGWENVLATPKGKIFYDGQEFPYLYYEDMLKELKVPKEGFVIKRDELSTFFDDSLPRLGLNEKEAFDFEEYWLGRLTDKQYYFIRFLTTEEIGAVEKLDLSKDPDTLIRVRALFIPLDEPINVPSQKLPESPPERSGFTVVEWGGFLEDPNESFVTTALDVINAGLGYLKHIVSR